jgi:hypothetical protein
MKQPTEPIYQFISQQIKININNIDKMAYNITSKLLIPLILLILSIQA